MDAEEVAENEIESQEGDDETLDDMGLTKDASHLHCLQAMESLLQFYVSSYAQQRKYDSEVLVKLILELHHFLITLAWLVLPTVAGIVTNTFMEYFITDGDFKDYTKTASGTAFVLLWTVGLPKLYAAWKGFTGYANIASVLGSLLHEELQSPEGDAAGIFESVHTNTLSAENNSKEQIGLVEEIKGECVHSVVDQNPFENLKAGGDNPQHNGDEAAKM